MKDCIGLVETISVARGIAAADAMVKESPVRLLLSRPVHPGRYATVLCGEVDEVRRAVERGRDVAGDKLLDSLFLPLIHPSVLDAAFTPAPPHVDEALGIVETLTIASTLRAADAAAKTTAAELALVRLADGLGGKGYFLIAGTVEDVEASVEAAVDLIEPDGLIQDRVVIAQLHPELRAFLASADGAMDVQMLRALDGESAVEESAP